MALVQLADIVQPEFFANYMAENSPVSLALSTSGVVVPNSLMQAQLTQGGDTLNIPMWSDLLSPADLGGVDPNVSTDDPTDLSTHSRSARSIRSCGKAILTIHGQQLHSPVRLRALIRCSALLSVFNLTGKDV